jgi:hypothetical protein
MIADHEASLIPDATTQLSRSRISSNGGPWVPARQGWRLVIQTGFLASRPIAAVTKSGCRRDANARG